ncbi:putative avirulence-associated protein 3.4 [Toxoplasma gondii FOU]|uniref:Putative avirulence-associated protein 3.4 n=1 Tax=Toxoplasma gondii FOU TaxID=943167 RepID=A0A086LB55_TOXGO|nr:putative avirulence-associated protein 3.4 [Toxoplasma gondii FOU]
MTRSLFRDTKLFTFLFFCSIHPPPPRRSRKVLSFTFSTFFTRCLCQIQCLYTEDFPEQEDMTPPAIRLPADLKNEVVFTRSAFTRLRQRIKDLRVETEAARAEYRDLTRSFAVSQREKKQTMKVIEQLKQKFENVQLLRFGAGVSLEQLERAAAAVAAEKEQKLNRESMEDKGPAILEAQVRVPS